jgi:hypothetical protein
MTSEMATDDTLGYRFDGNSYLPNRYYPMHAQRQQLLEDISTALETEVWSDPDMADATDDERQEAVTMAFDGTHYQAPFWDNIMAIMQQSPYELKVERITADNITADEREELGDYPN